jgi:soluble lytic murein transglycosylase-like protein
MDILTTLFISVSIEFNLPPGLLNSICYVESKHQTRSIAYNDGKSHSYGICQVKTIACKQVGLTFIESDIIKPENNITCAAKYLAYQIKRYDGNIPRAVTAFNKGNSTGDGYSIYYKKVLNEWKETKTWANLN